MKAMSSRSSRSGSPSLRVWGPCVLAVVLAYTGCAAPRDTALPGQGSPVPTVQPPRAVTDTDVGAASTARNEGTEARAAGVAPPVYYLHENALWRIDASGRTLELSALPGDFLAGIVLEDGFAVVTSSAVLGFGWSRWSFEELYPFPRPVDSGYVQRLGPQRAAFQGHVYEGDGETHYGVVETSPWRVEAGSVRGSVSVVGYHAAAGHILLLPRGQDPDYGTLVTVDPNSGEVIGRSEIHGYGNPVVAEMGDRLIAAETVPSADKAEGETRLREYRTSQDGVWVEGNSVSLGVGLLGSLQLVWDDQGSAVYIMTDEPPTTLGFAQGLNDCLWRWDLNGQPLARTSVSVPEPSELVAMSAGEPSWLIRAKKTGRWFHVADGGSARELGLPRGASVVASPGWRLASPVW